MSKMRITVALVALLVAAFAAQAKEILGQPALFVRNLSDDAAFGYHVGSGGRIVSPSSPRPSVSLSQSSCFWPLGMPLDMVGMVAPMWDLASSSLSRVT
jgi:hypothetical protein